MIRLIHQRKKKKQLNNKCSQSEKGREREAEKKSHFLIPWPNFLFAQRTIPHSIRAEPLHHKTVQNKKRKTLHSNHFYIIWHDPPKANCTNWRIPRSLRIHRLRAFYIEKKKKKKYLQRLHYNQLGIHGGNGVALARAPSFQFGLFFIYSSCKQSKGPPLARIDCFMKRRSHKRTWNNAMVSWFVERKKKQTTPTTTNVCRATIHFSIHRIYCYGKHFVY